nr:hypothetical protein GCM10020185_13450 [Pseudomonas brassicacearum subsp. brassicacearum]
MIWIPKGRQLPFMPTSTASCTNGYWPPDSFALAAEAERWVEIGLDMLHLSPSLRK